MEKRIYRSRQNRVISGVCGGLGEYFSIDPTILRILWIVIGFAGGAGLIAYIIAAVIMPEGDFNHSNYHQGTGFSDTDKNEWREPVKFDSARTNLVLGGLLIFVGLMFFLKQFLHWFDFSYVVPVVLILIGAAILFRGRGY